MIPVVWFNQHPDACHPKDHWDTAWLQELILDGYEEWNGNPEDFPTAAVVMIAGRFHADDLEAINRTLGYMDGCVVVVHSDEESLFPWWELEHPRMRRWVMTPAPGTRQDRPDPRWRSPGADAFDNVTFIGEGWSPGAPEVVARNGLLRRQFDWVFMGQVTHPRRVQCADVLRKNYRWSTMSAHLQETTSFADGVPQDEYLRRLAEGRLAPCPTGPVTADSFRIYEALEAGCIPLLDGIDGKGRDASPLWDLLFGPHHPLPVIWDWADLPDLVPLLLEDWDEKAQDVQAWWTVYKEGLVEQMAEDVKAIS